MPLLKNHLVSLILNIHEITPGKSEENILFQKEWLAGKKQTLRNL